MVKKGWLFLKTFSSVLNGTPAHDAITHIFRYLDKDKFADYLHKYSNDIMDFPKEHHISIDRKVCRATNKEG